MRVRNILLASAAMAAVLILACGGGPAQSRETVTKETVDAWMTELSNWGRWGDDDQMGTINLITPEKRKQAAALVSEGIAVSLARNAEKVEAPDNPNPFDHRMLQTGATTKSQFVSDNYSVSYHGWAHTHMDSLSHMSWQGKMYNGLEQRTEVVDEGAKSLAVTNFKNGIFTRGILMDIPSLKGIEYLEPGTPIYPEDLDAWEKKSGVKVGSGDVVFIRTGRWKLRDEKGPWAAGGSAAGLHASSARWLRERDIAMLGSELGSDVMPSGVDGVVQPIHQLMLIAFGTPIFDNCDLEAVAAEAAKQKRWEFLITASPIPVPGGTGSPLNPIAVF